MKAKVGLQSVVVICPKKNGYSKNKTYIKIHHHAASLLLQWSLPGASPDTDTPTTFIISPNKCLICCLVPLLVSIVQL